MGRPWPGTQGTANIHPRCEAPTHICTRPRSKVWPEGMVMPLHIPGSGWRCRGAYQRSKQRPNPGSEERTTDIGCKSMVVENQTLASSYSCLGEARHKRLLAELHHRAATAKWFQSKAFEREESSSGYKRQAGGDLKWITWLKRARRQRESGMWVAGHCL